MRRYPIDMPNGPYGRKSPYKTKTFVPKVVKSPTIELVTTKKDSKPVTKKSGRHTLTVHRDGKNRIWIKCITIYCGGQLTEYLYPANHKADNCFVLTARVADSKVPMMVVTRRHNTYPIHSIVRL